MSLPLRSLQNAGEYSVGWIAPLPIERAAVEALLDEQHDKPLDFNQPPTDKLSYSWGSSGEHNIVIASLKAGQYGLVPAAVLASAMLSSFPEIKFGLLVGIGGGIPRIENDGEVDIRLGDVVVSEPSGSTGGVVQFDLIKAGVELQRKDFLNSPPEVLLYALSNLKSQHEQRPPEIPKILEQMESRNPYMFQRRPGFTGFGYQGQENDRLFKANYTHQQGRDCRNCLDSEKIPRESRTSTEPNIHYGIIASGNTLVKDSYFREQILEHIPDDCICYEMEAAGLMNNFPCLVVRGICDYADSHKNDRWQRYAAAAAAAYAKELLSYVPVHHLQQTPKAIDRMQRTLDQLSEDVNDIRSGVRRVEQHNRSIQDKKIFDWLSATDFALRKNDFIYRLEAGTGRWFLDSPEFQYWKGHSRNTLFCPGMPGAGKTMITTIVTDHLQKEFKHDSTVGIAYIYCYFKGQDQKPEDLLSNLLKQLLQEQAKIPQLVASLYEFHHIRRTRPTFDDLVEAFKIILKERSRTFILVDALDEYQASHSGWKKFLSAILEVQTYTATNLLVTSRPISEIEKAFTGSVSLEIRAKEEDVRRYVNTHLSELPSFVSSRPRLQEQIEKAIVTAVDGMFLLAQLYLNSLSGQMSPKDMKIALERLPSGAEAYDYAYKETMQRIKGQVPGRISLALQILSWVTHARRPLTPRELRHALATEHNSQRLDREKLSSTHDLVSICAGLITADRQSNVIRLVHYTTQIFFLKNQDLYFPDSHSDMGLTCMTYLSFDVFDTGYCRTRERYNTRLEQNPFYKYAATSWSYHVRHGSLETSPLTLQLFSNKSKVSAVAQCMIPHYFVRQRYNSQGEEWNGVTSENIAAHLGFCGLMAYLQRLPGFDINRSDTMGRTALWYASAGGHAAMVDLLVEAGALPNNLLDPCPLTVACGRGHTKVVQALLKRGSFVNAKETWGTTAVVRSSPHIYDHQKFRMLLLENAKRNTRSGWQQKAHPEPSRLNRDNIVEWRYEEGDNDSEMRIWGPTALFEASAAGHIAIVQTLLNHGAAVNQRTWWGATALSQASGAGHIQIVRMLLDHGANAKERYRWNAHPLYEAVGAGYDQIVQMLLENGANVKLSDTVNRSYYLLDRAYRGGNMRMVKMLLDKGASFTDEQGDVKESQETLLGLYNSSFTNSLLTN
ncbi:MAG: hypothetical protein M1821_006696 [Bathelium mastoideum]|nr:MAG: hypothetical protein M1821_006696 [Bathelium mastoideum]